MRELTYVTLRRVEGASHADKLGQNVWVWAAHYERPACIETGRIHIFAGAGEKELIAALPPRLREAAAILGFPIDFAGSRDAAPDEERAPVAAPTAA